MNTKKENQENTQKLATNLIKGDLILHDKNFSEILEIKATKCYLYLTLDNGIVKKIKKTTFVKTIMVNIIESEDINDNSNEVLENEEVNIDNFINDIMHDDATPFTQKLVSKLKLTSQPIKKIPLTKKIGSELQKVAFQIGFSKDEVLKDYLNLNKGILLDTNVFEADNYYLTGIVDLKSKDTSKKRYFSVTELQFYKSIFLESLNPNQHSQILNYKYASEDLDDLCFEGIVLSKHLTLFKYFENYLNQILNCYPNISFKHKFKEL